MSLADRCWGLRVKRSDGLTAGVLYTLGAFLLWGLMPPYWKLIANVPALQIPAHRIVGSDCTIKGDAARTSMRRLLLAFEGHRVLSSGRIVSPV